MCFKLLKNNFQTYEIPSISWTATPIHLETFLRNCNNILCTGNNYSYKQGGGGGGGGGGGDGPPQNGYYRGGDQQHYSRGGDNPPQQRGFNNQMFGGNKIPGGGFKDNDPYGTYSWLGVKLTEILRVSPSVRLIIWPMWGTLVSIFVSSACSAILSRLRTV